MRILTVAAERWPIAGSFTISRGSRTEAEVVVVSVKEGDAVGRGECVPYARYGESVESVLELIRGQAEAVGRGLDRAGLQSSLPAGAARNALDCALWDLEAKLQGIPAWQLAGLAKPQPVVTAYTLSLGQPDAMKAAAVRASHRPLLKVKLGGDGDAERIRAVREGAPAARLIVDANEAWTSSNLEENLTACRAVGVELIEQPFPAADDAALADISEADRGGIVFCADESFHDSHDVEKAAEKYQAVNIKLDKTGGLTEAIVAKCRAHQNGLKIMVGCMVGTSLAMAPAMLVAQSAEYVDLDGPLLLATDRQDGLKFSESLAEAYSAPLWG
jgi:L-alanine-DL-glutamate epimerase-like enolase superfamily enzyme